MALLLGARAFSQTGGVDRITGPSSSVEPFLTSGNSGTDIYAVLTAGDAVPRQGGGAPYLMASIPDGMGAFDNFDGTFTLLLNHELSPDLGALQAHGETGAFLAQYRIRKSDFAVLSGRDVIVGLKSWGGGAFAEIPAAAEGEPNLRALNRLCSGDLPPVTAFYKFIGGLGTRDRMFMHGEEAGPEGRAFATVVTGPDAGTSFHVPHLGRGSWENVVASPWGQDKTVVALLDDSHEGELYFYVGTKNRVDPTPVQRAGLVGGDLFGVRIPGKEFEVDPGNEIGAVEPFDLADLGDVSGLTGEELTEAGDAAGVTKWGRPEDGVWDPRPGQQDRFYWVTTGGRSNGRETPTRLWCMEFHDIAQPELGGTIRILADGSQPGPDFTTLDNMTMDKAGIIYLQEDPGGSERLARIWAFDLATGRSWEVARHSGRFFHPLSGDLLTTNEESSGIIPLEDIVGPGWFALGVQAHFSLDSASSPIDAELRARFGLSLDQGVELVEGGQIVFLNLRDAEPSADFSMAIGSGEAWQYSDVPGLGWEDPGYDDAGWQSGAGQFGFGEGDEGTVLDASSPAWFFRKAFSVADPAAVGGIDLFVKADDGVSVFVNGQPVYADNLPPGVPDDSTLADDPAPDDGQVFRRIAVPASVLVAGENVVAASVHQVDPSSIDLSFDLALQLVLLNNAGSPPAAPSDLEAGAASPTELVLTWQDNAGDESRYLVERRSGLGPWQIVADELPADATTFTDLVSPGDAFWYRVQAANAGGLSGYSNAVLAATPPGNTDAILAEDFSSGTLGTWRQISVASNYTWRALERDGLTYAEMNGFGADAPSDDWLVSPRVHFDDLVGERFSFDSIKNFDGPDLEVLVSTDFDGGGDPVAATWQPLDATLSPGGYAQTNSGQIDLTGISGSGFLAFRYLSTGTGGGDSALWRVTNIVLNAVPVGGGALYPQQVPVVAREILTEVAGETVVRNGGYGSGMARSPRDPSIYYFMTDRGPNFDGPSSGEKIFPVPDFAPLIGVFREEGGEFVKVRDIVLRNQVGFPLTGLPNPEGFGGTGETPLNPEGFELALDPTGIDPEGLVAMPDGTFWVSDEYGPHIIHFAADGRTIERINPFGLGIGGRRLPNVYANRRANRGMEGLAVTPDGQWLVGIMQSAMLNPPEDRAAVQANSAITRIVFFNIRTSEVREYAYVQERAGRSNSEIRALSNTEFVVLERDGNFPNGSGGGAVKRFYKIDIAGATDVNDPANGFEGLRFGGKTLEQLYDAAGLAEHGIVPVEKKLLLDLLRSAPDYPHDKPEGFEVDGDVLEIINDDDFAISQVGGAIIPKVLPATREVDRNVLWRVAIPPLRADFIASASEVLSSESVQFTADVEGGVGELTFEWDFGDGETSGEQNPSHRFAQGGSYTVTLIVRDQDGNMVAEEKVDLVSVTQATEQRIAANIADLRVATFNASLNRGLLVPAHRGPQRAGQRAGGARRRDYRPGGCRCRLDQRV
ncbi:MAG: esterase-like activity of phytase family protein [Verrucomicrobiales bacterium]